MLLILGLFVLFAVIAAGLVFGLLRVLRWLDTNRPEYKPKLREPNAERQAWIRLWQRHPEGIKFTLRKVDPRSYQ